MRHALFQHSLAQLDWDAVAQALDAVPHLVRADARRLVNNAFGVLADGLVYNDAQLLHRALGALGLATEIAAQAWLQLPPLTRCIRAEVTDAGLVVYDAYERPTVSPWHCIVLLATGRYPAKQRLLGDRATAAAAQTPPGLLQREHLALDIIADTPQRYRIVPGGFDYSYLGSRRAYTARENFVLLMRDLTRRATDAAHNRGVGLLGRDMRRMYRYPGEQQFERESAWTLWRYLGPGSQLDGGGPYRAQHAGSLRLTQPLCCADPPSRP